MFTARTSAKETDMPRSRLALAVLSGSALVAIVAIRPAEAQRRGDVQICHHAGPTKTVTLHVSPSGAAAHLANHDGDRIGSCSVGDPS
jgi:hypothetical protein